MITASRTHGLSCGSAPRSRRTRNRRRSEIRKPRGYTRQYCRKVCKTPTHLYGPTKGGSLRASPFQTPAAGVVDLNIGNGRVRKRSCSNRDELSSRFVYGMILRAEAAGRRRKAYLGLNDMKAGIQNPRAWPRKPRPLRW